MSNGRVIFLNGTSSSGKTTIAKALQEKLAEPAMHVSVDRFLDMYPEKYLDPTLEGNTQVLAHLVPAVVSGFHGSIAALARAGNHLIVDHVLQEDGWLQECVESWMGLDVLFVGVRCPLEIVEQREKERGDRMPGTARRQFDRVHSHGVYDIEVDTSLLTLVECVAVIMKKIHDKPRKPFAFKMLAIKFGLY